MPGKFGDYVSYDLRRSHGGDIEYAYVIGEPSYSENGSHLMLADEKFIGMPINEGNCLVVSSGHDELCQRLSDKWHKRFPDWKMKPMTALATGSRTAGDEG